MLAPYYFREGLEETIARLKKRGVVLDTAPLEAFESKRKTLQMRVQELQNQRNQLSRAIGQAKSKGESADALMAEVASVNKALPEQEAALVVLQQEIHDVYASIPNLPHHSVPEGSHETHNVEVARVGDLPASPFPLKDHVDVGIKHGLHFEDAAKLSGSRFMVLYGNLARLYRALGQWMLDVHTQQHGYQEVSVPVLVRPECLFGTGQLPKFRDDLFFTQNGDQPLGLIPTAEVSLTNLVRDQLLSADELPKQFTALTPCFRSEAGSYGRDTRGMLRHHQFDKVELVQVVPQQDSYDALERLRSHAEAILQKLQLPYRVMLLCAGDMGFSASKTYDLEVWFPGEQAYREISSCSCFEDFQARRMSARYRDTDTGKNEYVHTLNGSGLPLGRTLAAILEHYQTESGALRVPEVLVPYMGGVTLLSPEH